MNQAELIEKLAETAELDKAQAGRVVEGILSAVAEALKTGDKVTLQSLGIFEISERAARQGRNPATGEAIQIAASKAVKFRPAKSLRDALNPPGPKSAPKSAPAKKAALKKK